jgi:alkyl hydroperoxide reductase subunit F
VGEGAKASLGAFDHLIRNTIEDEEVVESEDEALVAG